MQFFAWRLPVHSGLKLKRTHNLFFNHNACLKRDQLTRWKLFCVQLLKFPSQNVRLCSIAKVFDWPKCWVSLITKPNRSQSNDRSLIEFDYRTSDWLGRAYEISAQFWHNACEVAFKILFHKRSRQFHFLLVVKEHRKPLNLPLLLKVSSPTVP